MILVFDTETDNLLTKVTKMHCAGAIDVNTKAEYWFNTTNKGDEQAFLDLLNSADKIIAHNAFGFDVPMLTKLFKFQPKAEVECTLVRSQLQNFNRFGFGHSLGKWGEFLKNNKGDYKGGWDEFNPEMYEYMKQDVRLLLEVYEYLEKERINFENKYKVTRLNTAIQTEYRMEKIMIEQCQNGWKFDKAGAVSLIEDLDARIKETETLINPFLGSKVKPVDSKEVTLKFTKLGKYPKNISNWFNIEDNDDDVDLVENGLVWGNYTRVEYAIGDVGNTDTVKEYLYSIGWKPDEWNYKKVGDALIKTSAKLTESSLLPLGEPGEALNTFYTLRSRQAILKGFLDYVDENSRIHGDVFNIGTPTFRQTHKIIANLPSGQALYGPEFRKLFITAPGYKLVSADSAACQLRLLAHYMQDPKFTETVLYGDIHQMNADILGCTRAQAKRFIFAFLYGAGAAKLAGYIGKSVEETRKSIEKFKRALPALAKLISKCKAAIEQKGFILGLDHRPIMLNRNSTHKSLNYLIQGAEAVVMKATIVMIHEELRKAKIDFNILLFYHDEVTYEVVSHQKEEAREIIMRCFEEAPKQFGVNIMKCGDCKIGSDYYEVH